MRKLIILLIIVVFGASFAPALADHRIYWEDEYNTPATYQPYGRVTPAKGYNTYNNYAYYEPYSAPSFNYDYDYKYKSNRDYDRDRDDDRRSSRRTKSNKKYSSNYGYYSGYGSYSYRR